MGLDLIHKDDAEMFALAQIAAQVATYIMQGDMIGVDLILKAIDDDASWETAATFIGMLSASANVSQWGIGEILYFLRHRYNHETVAVYEYKGGDDWPEDLFTFIEKRFHSNLTALVADSSSAIVDFLGWTAYKFDKFWLLVGEDEIRVWAENRNDEPTAEQWEDMISRSITPLISGLNDKTAWALYSNVASWPRSARRDHLAWTIHYETRNLKAAGLPNSYRGDERHEEAGRLANVQIDAWENEGRKVTTQLVRSNVAKQKREKQGWAWKMPKIEMIYVEDTDTGEVSPAIIVADPLFQEYLLFHTRLSTVDIPPRRKIQVDGNDDILMDGSYVGALINLDTPYVDAAISKLMKTLKWEVI